ncbi:FecCD family ABC transporter permease [Streptomyces uncialis]|uniref:FecCD family ABC transporter permease n=1 Tax=Streptomyces uncialis TaxID=1048205 RepID=UPI00224ED064|nr:iron chelate uptake ABC transporter family permease subunit [Streptomyces uncialis]MCX4657759.1 iron chelate uptake ABC transporter family permease subunit [Streptomyces uncialis]
MTTVHEPAPGPSVLRPDEDRAAARRVPGLMLSLFVLVVTVPTSLAVGANELSAGQVWTGFWQRDGSEESVILWDLRVPRTVAGVVVGAALGVAGASIQALTRNPLADSGILGVNAGAGFAVTLGAGFFGLSGITGYVWFAFVGAAAATVLVYLIGAAGRGTASPVTLVLAGVALGAVLNGFSTFLTLIDPETFRSVRAWGLGSIARTSLDDTVAVAPFLAVGLLIALVVSGSLNSMALGDDLAVSLGAKVLRTRVLGVLAVTLLAGGATALTGGIAFVGLMVPHVVRWFVGPDQRWITVHCALAGPVLVLAADTLGKVIARPGEIEVAVLTAVIGAPVLIALVRRRKVSGL